MGEDLNGRSVSEEIYRAVIQAMGLGFAHCRLIYEGEEAADWLYLEVNPAFYTCTGLKNVEGRRISELQPDLRATSPDVFQMCDRVVRTGVPEVIETYLKGVDAWQSIRVFRSRPGEFVATFENITERKQLESDLREANLRKDDSLAKLDACKRALDGSVVSAQDVAERKRAEEALRESEDRYADSSNP